MIKIKFNLSKLNGSKWINWVKSMWIWIGCELRKNPKELKRKYICKVNIFVKTFTNRIQREIFVKHLQIDSMEIFIYRKSIECYKWDIYLLNK